MEGFDVTHNQHGFDKLQISPYHIFVGGNQKHICDYNESMNEQASETYVYITNERNKSK